MMKNTTHDIINSIKSRENEVIDNLENESIEVYTFLQEQFEKDNIMENALFQFVYRSFYRLDNAGLTKVFKHEYFKIMQELRDVKDIDPCYIVNRLYHFPRLKGDNSIQFSFATKMMNTINHENPIYDSEVAKVFGFSTYHIKDTTKRMQRYLRQYKLIEETYETLLKDDSFRDTLCLFDQKFTNNTLPSYKKIDFIFWSTGKVL